MSSSAPDVDLKSRGFSNQTIVAGLAAICGLFLFLRGSSREASLIGEKDEEEDDEAHSTGAWVLWTFLWCVYRLAQLALSLMVFLLAVLVARQRSMIYVPVPPGAGRSPKDNTPAQYRSPKAWDMPFEDVTISTEDGTRVNAWLVLQPVQPLSRSLSEAEEAPYTIVFFHGNAGNIGHRLENIRDMHTKLKANVLILDYRGYGDSEDGGGPCQAGFLMDAEAAYRWLVERIRNPPTPSCPARMSTDRIVLFGRSIGGCVATILMHRLVKQRLLADANGDDPKALPLPAGIVLENTLTSMSGMAVQIFPFLGLLRPLLRAPILFDEWRTDESMKFLAANHEHWCCCLLSGLQDALVPPVMSVHLHNILRERRPQVLKFFRFQHGGHNDTPNKAGAEYWECFQKFMALVAQTEANRVEAMRTWPLPASPSGVAA